jgi:hypothetical protein
MDLTPPGWSRSAWTGNDFYGYQEHVNGATVQHGDDVDDYQPDVAFGRAVSFLREAPADRPVFAWITPYVTHNGTDPFRTDWPWGYSPVAQRFRGDERCSPDG